MKLAYQNKLLENLEAEAYRCKLLKNSITGEGKQLSKQEAVKLLQEIEQLINSNRSLIELVPTE